MTWPIVAIAAKLTLTHSDCSAAPSVKKVVKFSMPTNSNPRRVLPWKNDRPSDQQHRHDLEQDVDGERRDQEDEDRLAIPEDTVHRRSLP